MAMFHFDIAFMLEVLAFASGLTLLHFGRAGAAILLRAAGAVLIVASLATAACSIYYGIRYHVQGEFDHASGRPPGCEMAHDMMHRHGGMRGLGGMHGMPGMGGRRMTSEPAGAGPAATESPADGLESPGSD